VRPVLFSAVPRATGSVFTFCTEGVRSHFHVSGSRTRFRRCRVRSIPFSCFACPDSFLAIPTASGPFSCFRRYRGRPVPFSCFVLQDMFSAVPSASSPVFMCCPRTRFRRYRGRRVSFSFFDGTEGVRSCFHVLRTRTRFRRYRGHRVPFSCFARPDLFPTVPRASDPILKFCAP
jgi:hypothetical protein